MKMTLEKFIKIQKYKSLISTLLFFIICIIFFYRMNLSFNDYFVGFKRLSSVIYGMFSIDFSDYAIIILKVFETFLIAFSSTAIAIILSVFISPFLTSHFIKNKIILKILNLIFSCFRTTPALVFAAILVSLIGIGSFTGFLSLLFITFFSATKLLKEYIEEIPRDKINNFYSLGLSKFTVFRSLILPTATPYIFSLFFLTLESSIRGASVLGMVGAGGIGEELWKNLNYLRYDKVSFIILILLFFIFLTDTISMHFRKNKFFLNLTSWESYRNIKYLKKFSVLIFILAIIISVNYLSKDSNSVETNILIERLAIFLKKFKNFDFLYLKKAFYSLFDSFLVAFFSTFFGAITSIFITFFTVSKLNSNSKTLFAKFIINLIRTFPPVIVAIIFFAGFGPGLISGFFALYFYTTGVITKIYTDTLESISTDFIIYGQSIGLKKFYLYLKILFPATFTNFISIVLYRLESNMKNSSVLGMVGAGGIGELLINNISFRNWERVWVLLGVLILAIYILEIFSVFLREKINA